MRCPQKYVPIKSWTKHSCVDDECIGNIYVRACVCVRVHIYIYIQVALNLGFWVGIGRVRTLMRHCTSQNTRPILPRQHWSSSHLHPYIAGNTPP